MTIFDLLFLAAALCTLLTFIAASVLWMRHGGSSALRILRIWLVGAAAYLIVSVSVSFFRPQRTISLGEPWCFDDWCLTVERTQVTTTPVVNTYTVDLLIQSRARRITQRANGAWVYLLDERARRYSPDSDLEAVPLDVLLQPQQSIPATRTFHLPADARAVGLITGHGGPYCGAMNFLIIGSGGCLFHKPPMIRIG